MSTESPLGALLPDTRVTICRASKTQERQVRDILTLATAPFVGSARFSVGRAVGRSEPSPASARAEHREDSPPLASNARAATWRAASGRISGNPRFRWFAGTPRIHPACHRPGTASCVKAPSSHQPCVRPVTGRTQFWTSTDRRRRSPCRTVHAASRTSVAGAPTLNTKKGDSPSFGRRTAHRSTGVATPEPLSPAITRVGTPFKGNRAMQRSRGSWRSGMLSFTKRRLCPLWSRLALPRGRGVRGVFGGLPSRAPLQARTRRAIGISRRRRFVHRATVSCTTRR